MKLLIVEDNEMNLKVLGLLTKSIGFDVHSVENGREALFYIQTQLSPPDIILADIQMPIMDGFEFIRLLRENDDDIINSIPVFAVTAMAMEGDKEKILSHGFTGYIAKPINTRKVRTLLEEYKNNLL
jgi:CheY-like chemotaxis protein